MHDDLVSVYVPKSLVTEFSAWLASRLGLAHNGEAAPKPIIQSATPSSRLDQWTPEMVSRLVRDSAPAMRNILKLLAERAGDWVSSNDLTKVVKNRPGRNPGSTIAGTMGAFGRRMSHRYKNKYGITLFPFESQWSHEHHCKINKMPKEIAALVLQALKNGQ